MSNDDRGNNFMSRTRIDRWNFNSNTFHQSFIVHFGINRNQMIFLILSPSEYFNFLTLIDWIAHALPILFVIQPPPTPLGSDIILRVWHSYDSIWPSSSAAGAATRFISFFLHWFLNIVQHPIGISSAVETMNERVKQKRMKCAKNGNTGFLLMRSKSS